MNHKSSVIVTHKLDVLLVSQHEFHGCSLQDWLFWTSVWLLSPTCHVSLVFLCLDLYWFCSFLAFCCSHGRAGISKFGSSCRARTWRYLTGLEAGTSHQRCRLDTTLWAATNYTPLPPQQLTRWAQIKPLHHIKRQKDNKMSLPLSQENGPRDFPVLNVCVMFLIWAVQQSLCIKDMYLSWGQFH